jgi:hypothetical protein
MFSSISLFKVCCFATVLDKESIEPNKVEPDKELIESDKLERDKVGPDKEAIEPDKEPLLIKDLLIETEKVYWPFRPKQDVETFFNVIDENLSSSRVITYFSRPASDGGQIELAIQIINFAFKKFNQKVEKRKEFYKFLFNLIPKYFTCIRKNIAMQITKISQRKENLGDKYNGILHQLEIELSHDAFSNPSIETPEDRLNEEKAIADEKQLDVIL